MSYDYREMEKSSETLADGWSWTELDFQQTFPTEADPVNSPAHYTAGSQEAIVTIEEAIQQAPYNKAAFLQGQVLKYMLRLWHKDNACQDAKKARWYLDRLIESLDY